MKYFTYSNDDKMPLLGLGTWLSGKDEIYNAVREAIKIGYRHIDCAPIYGNEKEIGEAISDAIKDGDVTREELWITTKLWNNAHKKEDVIPTLKKSLSDLQLDYIDLYLIHWPIAQDKDSIFPNSSDKFISLDEIPISETWNEMEKIKELGLAKHIGVSNFSAKKINDIITYAKYKPEANQVEMHPHLQQNDLVKYCKSENIIITAYAPLGAGNWVYDGLNKGENIPLIKNETIAEIAKENNCSTAQVLLAWGLSRDIAVIPKSSNAERLKQNYESQSIELNKSQIEIINSLDKNHRYYDGTGWTIPGSPYTIENLWDE